MPLDSLQKMLDRIQKRREADAERFRKMDGDECMLCHAHGPDMRNLVMDCFYDISEAIPQAIDIHNLDIQNHKSGWYLRICKTCRGEFLGHIESWSRERIKLRGMTDSDGELLEQDYSSKNIPVRVMGMIVMMDEQEYEEFRKRGRE